MGEAMEVLDADTLEAGELVALNQFTGVTPTLTQLKETIQREHELALSHERAAIEHAIHAGEALLMARSQVPANEWKGWYQGLGLSIQSAQRYIRIATFKAELPEATTSVAAAIKWLRDAGHRTPNPGGRIAELSALYSRDERDVVVARYRQGESAAALAKEIGTTRATIYRWANPKRYQQLKAARKRRYRQQRVAAQEALRREELLKEAKRLGDAPGTAVSCVERARQAVDQARDQSQDREVRRAFGDAYAALLQAHEHLNTAAGLLHGGRS